MKGLGLPIAGICSGTSRAQDDRRSLGKRRDWRGTQSHAGITGYGKILKRTEAELRQVLPLA